MYACAAGSPHPANDDDAMDSALSLAWVAMAAKNDEIDQMTHLHGGG